MSRRTVPGALLDELVSQSIGVCQQAERQAPRQGPGRKPQTPDWVLAVMIVVGILLHKKSKAAQWAWWQQHAADFARWLPGQRMPCRSCFYARYGRMPRLLAAAIGQQGRHAIRQGWAQPECVAVDKSLIAGRGQRWSAAQRRSGDDPPPGVDGETTWGRSTHDGWVQGYAFETVVTAPHQGVIWPLLASVDTASRSEQKTILEKLPDLPARTHSVLADAGYDSNAVGEAVEVSPRARTRRRRFLCPEVPRPQTKQAPKCCWRRSRQRQAHQRWRRQRQRFFKSRQGRALYRRRKTSAEPFHARLKQAFALEDRVWHWGLANNRTMILAAIAAYQLLLTYNHRRGRLTAHVRHLLHAL